MRTIKPIAAKFRMHRSKNKRSIDSSSFVLYNMKAGMHIQKQFFSIILIFISSSFGAYNKIKFSFYLFWLVGCKMQAHTYVHEHRGRDLSRFMLMPGTKDLFMNTHRVAHS